MESELCNIIIFVMFIKLKYIALVSTIHHSNKLLHFWRRGEIFWLQILLNAPITMGE